MEDKRPRYEIVCPKCGKVQYACKSILQEGFGMDEFGAGTCIECGLFMSLKFDRETETMTASEMQRAAGI
jgi:predicted nucleic-acid-binding Zn-ribbon protein